MYYSSLRQIKHHVQFEQLFHHENLSQFDNISDKLMLNSFTKILSRLQPLITLTTDKEQVHLLFCFIWSIFTINCFPQEDFLYTLLRDWVSKLRDSSALLKQANSNIDIVDQHWISQFQAAELVDTNLFYWKAWHGWD